MGPNYPMFAGAIFLVFSLALYWLRFPEDREGFVVVYVLTCVLAFLHGTNLGGHAKLRPRTSTTISLGWLWLACLLLALTTTANISAYYTSLRELFQFILEPGDAYERVKFLARTDQMNAGLLGNSLGPFISMLTFTKYVVFGWAVLYWRQLPNSLRLVSVACMFYYSIQSVLIGAMVNVGTVLLSTMIILLVQGRRVLKNGGCRLFWRSVLPAVLGFTILSYFLGSREVGATGIRDRVAAGADGLIFYISHGYVGLGHALDQPFVFTGGQTALYGFTRVFTDGPSPLSYPVRSEAATGWSADQLWSTAAPWLASDVTFWGVPLVLLTVGFWGGRLWKECCITADPFALLLLGQVTIGVFFFPANNHLLQTFPNASGLAVITLLYLVSRLHTRTHYEIDSTKARYNARRGAMVR